MVTADTAWVTVKLSEFAMRHSFWIYVFFATVRPTTEVSGFDNLVLFGDSSSYLFACAVLPYRPSKRCRVWDHARQRLTVNAIHTLRPLKTCNRGLQHEVNTWHPTLSTQASSFDLDSVLAPLWQPGSRERRDFGRREASFERLSCMVPRHLFIISSRDFDEGSLGYDPNHLTLG